MVCARNENHLVWTFNLDYIVYFLLQLPKVKSFMNAGYKYDPPCWVLKALNSLIATPTFKTLSVRP